MSRYERNHPAISEAEQEILAGKRVLVAGCGGLGGYIIEFLGRIGVGHLTAVDGDVFADSNLNRQLLSHTETLGQPKPVCAQERMRTVNPLVPVTPVCGFITAENAAEMLPGHDVIVDALDNGPSRVILAHAAQKLKIPFVSGAISGWRGRVFVLMPDDSAADFLWGGEAGISSGNLCFTASAAASVQSAETVKLLLDRPGLLHGRFLEFDLLGGQWEDIPLELG
ncbi:MAG: HesA/MoeB/ThiF family protein [Clostridiales bacterium]|nr:HesA/MoeB/ThiF family protein [Clostridiales bacterium]